MSFISISPILHSTVVPGVSLNKSSTTTKKSESLPFTSSTPTLPLVSTLLLPSEPTLSHSFINLSHTLPPSATLRSPGKTTSPLHEKEIRNNSSSRNELRSFFVIIFISQFFIIDFHYF